MSHTLNFEHCHLATGNNIRFEAAPDNIASFETVASAEETNA